MTFWTERLELSRPSVCLKNIDGRDCVAYKVGQEDPTIFYFPRDPADLNLVLGLAIDSYVSVVSRTLGAEERGKLQLARERLHELTTSVEELPNKLLTSK